MGSGRIFWAWRDCSPVCVAKTTPFATVGESGTVRFGDVHCGDNTVLPPSVETSNAMTLPVGMSPLLYLNAGASLDGGPHIGA